MTLLFGIKNTSFPDGIEKFYWVVHLMPRAVEHKVCPTCNGLRKIGGGFHDLDDARECPTCFGKGNLSQLSSVVAPPELETAIQKLLNEHLEKT